MHLHTSTQIGKDAGERIGELLAEYKSIPVLLLLSGGSAMSVLEYIAVENIDERVSIGLVDERLNVGEIDSNARRLVQTKWFKNIKKHNVNLISIEEEVYKRWRRQHPEGKIITLLGMGTDGHIAGILPMPENEDLFRRLFIETDNWVTGYIHENTNNQFKERITITLRFLLESVDHIVLYTTGEGKCARLSSLSKTSESYIEPICALSNKDNVDVYTDCA